MKTIALSAINSWEEYKRVLDAITGVKKEFTQEEVESLLKDYTKNMKMAFGFSNEDLVKMVMVMDTAEHGLESSPLKNLLSPEDLNALKALVDLCGDWESEPQKVEVVKDAALKGDVSAPMALALARAALDAYAGQQDLTPYREDINALAEFLKSADEDAFADASVFLIRVRERVR